MRLEFDRGTLLVHGAGAHSRDLPGVVWDPRTTTWRAPAMHWRELRAGPDAISRRIGARRPIPAPSLRPYQETALQRWRAAGGRGLVCLPTGAGKTIVGVGAIARAGLPAMVLVPTRVLLHQWIATLRAHGFRDLGALGDGQRRVRRVTVSTYESAWRHMARLGDRFGLLVVDEAHHFGGGRRDEVLEMSVAPFRLGLTATPPPSVGALEILVGPVVMRLGLEALAGEFLAPFDLVELAVVLEPAEREAYERDMALFRAVHRPFHVSTPDASWAAFAKLASRSAEGRRALAALRRAKRLVAYPRGKARLVSTLLEQHDKARVLVFTGDNRTAYRVAREELVMPITCHIGRDERDEALAEFRAGRLRALVSARVLNEGLDVPAADVAVVVGSSQGHREHVQRIGRVLRPSEGKRAVVYELVTQGTNEVYKARSRRRDAAA